MLIYDVNLIELLNFQIWQLCTRIDHMFYEFNLFYKLNVVNVVKWLM